MRIDIKGEFGVSNARTLLRRNFGVQRGNNILLHPVEVAYLAVKGCSVYRNKKLDVMEVLKWCFENRDNVLLFFAFRDLRDRGRRVRISGKLLVGKDVFYPVSERETISFSEIYGKNFILAVVDEEGDVTYYKHYPWNCFGKQEEEIEEFEAIFAGDRVVTSERKVFEKYFYGSSSGEIVTLSLVEAMYLAEKGKMKLNLEVEELRREAERVEKNFATRYELYKDLKNRNFVVKTGFKFGSDFRVYEKVECSKNIPHSIYLVKIAEEMKASELASHVRVAGTVRKKMLFYFDRKYICFERVKI